LRLCAGTLGGVGTPAEPAQRSGERRGRRRSGIARVRASVRRGRGHPPALPVLGPRATRRLRRPPGGPQARAGPAGVAAAGAPPPTPLYDGARRTAPRRAARPPPARRRAPRVRP